MQFFADGKLHPLAEVFETLATLFKLTEAEQNEMLPSATQHRWHNRANWACYDLFGLGFSTDQRKDDIKLQNLARKLPQKSPASLIVSI